LDITPPLARLIVGTGAALLLAACATKPEIASDYDRSADFATYRTFKLVQREHRGIPNPLVITRVEEGITQTLQRRGYTLAADPLGADFAVDFTIGTQDRTDIHSYPATYAVPPLAGAFWGSNLDVRQYREGTLAINVFDQHTHRPVWHGSAQKELTRKELDQPAEPISQAVSSVLSKFPPA